MLNYSLLFTLLFSSQAFADGEHYKNTLIGGRAASMGGAYTAISDDASGAFHNPAGLSYATGNSFSGSANAFSYKKVTYKETISEKDWDRESKNLKPNYFGVVQKVKDQTFALSYALTDAFEEHQDQVYQNVLAVNPLDVYALNLHTQDNTYLVGPSWSKPLNDELSVGASAFVHYRVYRRAYSQLLRFSDGSDESTYQNTTKKEKGLRPKLGFMYNPKSLEKFSFGATLSKTMIITSLSDNQQNFKAKGASTFQFGQNSNTQKRRTPVELETGAAYFYNPYLLFSADASFYFIDDSTKEQVANLSVGSEYYLAEKHAVRAGLYTNRTNSKKASNSTSAPLEHINLYGITAGYTLYASSAAITFGTIYSAGKGEAQIYTNSSATRDVVKHNLDFMLSADYGF